MNELATDDNITGAVDQVNNYSEPQQSVPQQVPLEALQAERASRQNLQDELRIIKDHLALIQSQQQQSSQKPVAKDALESLDDGDVLTVGEFKKALSQKEQQYQIGLQELKISQKYPDYADIVSKYLPDVLNKNPSLRSTLQSSQDYELAYYLAKNSDAYKDENKKVRKHADAERIIQNSQQTGSVSNVGSTSPMNTARRYKDMSDEDFRQAVNRNMGSF